MEAYIKILNIAIPIFVLLIGIEWVIAVLLHKKVVRSVDVVSSLSSGLTNTIKDVLGLTIIIVSYDWLVDYIAFISMPVGVLTFVVVFILKDFAQYWSHRWEHRINIFWNRHVIHHSSEDFNLACALRQPISNLANIFIFLYIPMALLGVPTIVVATVAPLHLFAQFWYHTQLINKMGFLEHIVVTPSAHRVHHAINDIYLDRNFAAIFIIWDKLFGTYQEELEDVTPVYGVKRPVRTWNPIIINFQHLLLLIRDAWHTNSWRDKLTLWFRPTGFRPKDVAERFPEYTIDDVYSYQKYDSEKGLVLKTFAWTQLFIHLGLMLLVFNRMSDFSVVQVMWFGGFLFVSIFTFTSILDGSKIAFVGEALKWMVYILSYLIWEIWFFDGLFDGSRILFFSYMLLSLGFMIYIFSPKVKERYYLST
jgi:sterol desaturase/sphingolipid hydroxylase (fatty acid hydroxylase superfamily)